VDKSALQLASRFTLPPNSLGYCGKNTAPAKFITCAIDGRCSGVEAELTKFIVLHPYLATLPAITGQAKFSYTNIEAYWLGNAELSKATLAHYSLLLDNFTKQGVPDWLVEELRHKFPKKFIPFHLFQILHVGVGRASGAVPFNIDTINNCMVRWGPVTKIAGDHLTVKLRSLKQVTNRYQLTINSQSFTYRLDFLPSMAVGSIVAIHWQQVVKILTPPEIAHLDYWTRQVIATVQPA